MDSIRIGLVGYGMIGRVHALAYRALPLYYPNQLPPLALNAICTNRAESAQGAANELGINAWTTNSAELVARDDVDIIDVCAPNYAHREILLAALRANKFVLVEKPLALNLTQAREIVDAAQRANLRIGLIFNYRFVPAIARAKQLIDDGFLGTIYHFRFEYMHSGYQNPDRPMNWKLRKSQAGGGALVDLGAHVIDLTRFLIDEFAQVRATTRTYVTARPRAEDSSVRERVDVDDAAWLQAELTNGAQGELMVSRFATGTLDDLRFEIYGERGALRCSLMDGNWLYVYDGKISDASTGDIRGWTRLETLSRFANASAPPPRSMLAWERTQAENIFQFLKALTNNAEPQPNARDGLRVHQVIDAAYQSAENGEWMKVERG